MSWDVEITVNKVDNVHTKEILEIKICHFLNIAVQFGYCFMYYFIRNRPLKYFSVASLLEIWYIWINISDTSLLK